jgi:predicted DNA binding protein
VEHDIALELDRVYALEDLETGNHYGLTDEQREALLAAVLGGYFGVPRGTTLGDVAAELDISRQAASERIRRGAHVVLSKTLLESE